MTLEEYYGNKLPLLKQGEAYLKTLMETYPNSCNKDGLQAILYIKTRIKTPESMMEKLKRHGMKEDSHLHLIIRFTTDDLKDITAEIQLRTIALDFWAALEHQIKYKHNVPHEEIIRSELKRCADEIASVDLSMQTIREILQNDIWEQT